MSIVSAIADNVDNKDLKKTESRDSVQIWRLNLNLRLTNYAMLGHWGVEVMLLACNQIMNRMKVSYTQIWGLACLVGWLRHITVTLERNTASRTGRRKWQFCYNCAGNEVAIITTSAR